MIETALITGASSGIGLELARIHAKKGGHLVLVARSQGKLDALATELRNRHGVQVTVLAEDLSTQGAAQRIFAATEAAGIQVDILMNNAGVGERGLFF